ncbi:MAG: DUF131 domain-containing protein [Thermoplasmata archaeon]|nr:DUF131 domain-containing protein [Thermoplasmata archaeon]
MVTVPRWLPYACFALGIVVIADSVWTGGTRFYLILVFPVLTSSSPVFAVGVLLLLAGFFTLPFLVSEPEDDSPLDRRGGAASSGGVVIVGPFPLFFGSWRGASRRSYFWAALVGVALLVVLLAWVLLE